MISACCRSLCVSGLGESNDALKSSTSGFLTEQGLTCDLCRSRWLGPPHGGDGAGMNQFRIRPPCCSIARG